MVDPASWQRRLSIGLQRTMLHLLLPGIGMSACQECCSTWSLDIHYSNPLYIITQVLGNSSLHICRMAHP